MRRGGTRHPPRPRAPAAARQAPPSSHARGRYSTQILVTLRTRQLGGTTSSQEGRKSWEERGNTADTSLGPAKLEALWKADRTQQEKWEGTSAPVPKDLNSVYFSPGRASFRGSLQTWAEPFSGCLLL